MVCCETVSTKVGQGVLPQRMVQYKHGIVTAACGLQKRYETSLTLEFSHLDGCRSC